MSGLLDDTLKRLHLPTVRRLYAAYRTRNQSEVTIAAAAEDTA